MTMTTNAGARQMAQTPLARLPLFFRYEDQIVGHGYVATVTVRGRVLCCAEPDGSAWMHGVSPGGIDAGGSDPIVAHAEFRQAFREVLLDIAHDATPETFTSEVERFVNETNDPVYAEWRAAVLDVRAGRITAEGMKRLNADLPAEVSVRIDRTLTPDHNITRPLVEELVAA